MSKAKVRVSCNTVGFRALSVQQAFKNIADVGYKYVEVEATNPFCMHVVVDKDDPEDFRKLTKDFGFKGVTALWSTHGAIIPDHLSVEYGKRCIEWAKAAEVPLVIMGDGTRPKGMSDDDAFEILRQRLLQILETAEKNHIYLAIEPHGTFSFTAEGLNRIMSISSSKWLGINYDAANILRATYVEADGGAYAWKTTGKKHDEVAALKEVVGRVIHVHVKDVKGSTAVTLGTGEVNVKECLKVLKEAGYGRALSFETEGETEGEVAVAEATDSRKYLIDVLEELGVDYE